MIKYILALILVLSSYYFYHLMTDMDNNIEQDRIDALPTYIANNLESNIYNTEGKLYKSIFASHAEYYKSIDQTDLTKPRLQYIPKLDIEASKKNSVNAQNDEIWTLTADYGVLNTSDNINLRSNVVALTNNTSSIVQKITSQYLEIDFTTNEIRTPERVYIEGINFKNNGLKFLGNFKNKTFVLEEDCHATYSGFINKNK